MSSISCSSDSLPLSLTSLALKRCFRKGTSYAAIWSLSVINVFCYFDSLTFVSSKVFSFLWCSLCSERLPAPDDSSYASGMLCIPALDAWSFNEPLVILRSSKVAVSQLKGGEIGNPGRGLGTPRLLLRVRLGFISGESVISFYVSPWVLLQASSCDLSGLLLPN